MTKPIKVTLDSSVFISALRKQEDEHMNCLRLLEKIKNGELIALEPFTVLIEVVAAIKRRTNSQQLAEIVLMDLRGFDTIYFLDILESNAIEAAKIAASTGVKGMDAIVV